MIDETTVKIIRFSFDLMSISNGISLFFDIESIRLTHRSALIVRVFPPLSLFLGKVVRHLDENKRGGGRRRRIGKTHTIDNNE